MEDLKKNVAKIDEKLDVVTEKLSQISIIQAEQATDLKYHIKRTDQIEDKLLPLVDIKHKFDGAFKLIGMCGTGLGLIFGAVKAVEIIIKLF